ncbi:hypothetical protein THASP1DRAFT_23352 [Thamnocephalis sphaerospora]|uniref:Uncharacterized protein n=1 Tax=Thamnocephalis sphaerospora TaxID=78915 RepID=A0A4V1IWT8_9FUNG|nr:hypothetical protein THASP1DRAFT_23352 [Thamnocephalis sphaerospora]|eukprot:RKP08709.1 hypothetical protein THASP1DRAFT_23352 [Thamnocephalis sphaerospora]
MVWGNKEGHREALDSWLQRLRTNDAHFTSLHVLPARRLTPDEFAELFAALADNHTLTQLYCSTHAQSDASLTALAEALGKNHTLQRLAVGDSHLAELAPIGCAALCAAVGASQSILELDLDNKGLGLASDEDGDEEDVAVGEALRNMIASSKSLSRLSLARNELRDIHAQLIAAGIRANTTGSGRLTNLDLGYNALGVETARALAAPCTSASPESGLHELSLSGNEQLGVEGMVLLGAALHGATLISSCRKLQLADMAFTPVAEGSTEVPVLATEVSPGDNFLRAFAQTTEAAAPALEMLRLDRSGVTATGAKALGQILSDPRMVLSEVALRGNALCDEGAACLAVDVSSSAAAGFSLDLSENHLTDAGLAPLLTRSRSITQLVLFGNHITLDTVADVAALMQLHRMTLLDLSRNRIQAAGFARLADQLIQGAFPKLRQLEIAGNVDARQSNDDGADTSEEVKAWAEIAAKVEAARPDLVVAWR